MKRIGAWSALLRKCNSIFLWCHILSTRLLRRVSTREFPSEKDLSERAEGSTVLRKDCTKGQSMEFKVQS